MVGVAETGSGKTLTYALPILHRLKTLELDGNPIKVYGEPRAIVVVPTRELGEQVAKAFKPFTHTTRLRVRSLLGGTTMEVAKRSLQGAFEVLVATPGRLIKMMDAGLVTLGDVRMLVLDEADQMVDHGFLPDVRRIVKKCPADRQLALFSATLPPAVEKLIAELFSGTILFTNTREQCDKLAEELEEAGWPCVVYRGEMDKSERRRNLKSFRDGEVALLISTDLASRGLDVEHVGRVINYHLPRQMENYLHRVGRTARAGRPGLVVNFITERDAPLVSKLDAVRASPKVSLKAK